MFFESPRLGVVLPAIIVAVVILYRLSQIGRRDPRLPPGPPTLPLIGNFHQIPPSGLFKQFKVWAKEYGPVFSLKLGPTTIVVLHSRKAIHKLLVEKGAKYSGRKETYLIKLVTRGENISMVDDHKHWREKRKLISHYLSPKQLDEKHYKVQEAEATILMNSLVDRAEDFYDEIRRYTVSVITSLTFGYRAATFQSFWSHSLYETMEKFSEAMEPGATPPVDEYPFLRFIPAAWAPWKRKALIAGKAVDDLWTEARRRLEVRRATGVRRNCVSDMILDDWEGKGSWPISQREFNLTLGEFVSGGADTTASQLLTLVLAFAKYPHVQEKARKELDAVCGTSRAPVWDDFSRLPYINATVKEGMRWRPTAVAAIPHYSKEDDWYDGMLIPKNTLMFIPTWSLHHSEELFGEDHDVYNPDRYLGYDRLANDYAGSPDYERRDHYNYGAGRRICPGIHLAERNMWRIAAKLLWAFEFSEPIDPHTGKVVPIDPDAYSNGILVMAHRYKVTIKPRSEEHVRTIRADRDRALEFLKQFDDDSKPLDA